MTGFETGFPVLPRSTGTGRQIAELQERLARVQQEVVTGQSSDPVAQLAGRTAEAAGIEGRLTDLSRYRSSIGLSSGRAEAQQSAIGAMRESVAELTSQTQTALNARLPNGISTIAAQARQTLDSVIGALNKTFGGRGLFAGDGPAPAMTDASTISASAVSAYASAPSPASGIAAVQAVFDTPGGTYDTSFYLGGAGAAPGTEIDRDRVLRIDQRADGVAYRSVIRDIITIETAADPANVMDEGTRRALLEDGLASLRSSSEQLIDAAAAVGAAQAELESAAARVAAEEATLSVTLAGLTGRDGAEAATEFTALEAQIETLFLTSSRIARLSLTSFLR